MTVGELLDTMSSSELSEWQAFDQLSPFGPERADLRAGIVTQAIFATRGIEARIEDCMPNYGASPSAAEPEGQSVEAQLAFIRMISAPFLAAARGSLRGCGSLGVSVVSGQLSVVKTPHAVI